LAREYFEAGGPIMYAVLATWVVVLAGVLDRVLYAVGHVARRPFAEVRRALREQRRSEAEERYLREQHRSRRALAGIDSVSQLATSLGLFGTVVGIARAFFGRAGELDLAAPEVLAQGLSTALFTTIAGLTVFLFGQGFLILYESWVGHVEGDLALRLVSREEGR
jgi:biopolymer transport protein ExbB/TolQ